MLLDPRIIFQKEGLDPENYSSDLANFEFFFNLNVECRMQNVECRMLNFIFFNLNKIFEIFGFLPWVSLGLDKSKIIIFYKNYKIIQENEQIVWRF